MISHFHTYTAGPKSGIIKTFCCFWKSHQRFIYLIKNTIAIVKMYYDFKLFSILIYFKMLIISVMSKLNFQHHYSCLQCECRNHSNTLICCSRNLSMLKAIVLLNIHGKLWYTTIQKHWVSMIDWLIDWLIDWWVLLSSKDALKWSNVTVKTNINLQEKKYFK